MMGPVVLEIGRELGYCQALCIGADRRIHLVAVEKTFEGNGAERPDLAFDLARWMCSCLYIHGKPE